MLKPTWYTPTHRGLSKATKSVALWFGKVFPLKIKLNHNWTFQRNWDVPLVLLERSWKPRFIGIYFIGSGLRMGKILNFKCFFVIKNSNKSPKNPSFGRKNQLRMGGFTLGPSAQATHRWRYLHLHYQKRGRFFVGLVCKRTLNPKP
jgi:hypothetical protein